MISQKVRRRHLGEARRRSRQSGQALEGVKLTPKVELQE